MDKGKILTPKEWERLIELLGLLNNLNITQLDGDESTELRALMTKLGS